MLIIASGVHSGIFFLHILLSQLLVVKSNTAEHSLSAILCTGTFKVAAISVSCLRCSGEHFHANVNFFWTCVNIRHPFCYGTCCASKFIFIAPRDML